MQVKKIGHNDPCPCGSGKKYKQCCMQKEHKTLDFEQQLLNRKLPVLRERIVRFALNEWEPAIDAALARWGKKGYAVVTTDETYYHLFLSWLIFNYPCGQQTIFEHFIQQEAASLGERILQMLQGWRQAYPSLYEVMEVAPGEHYLLRDVFTRQEYHVEFTNTDAEFLAPAELEMLSGEYLVLTVLVKVGNRYDYFLSYLGFAAEGKAYLIHKLTAIYQAKVAQGLIAAGDWPAFLRKFFPELLFLIYQWLEDGLDDAMDADREIMDDFPWISSQEAEVALLFVREMQDEFDYEDLLVGVALWHIYYQCAHPQIRSRAAQAAAITYLASEMRGKAKLTQKELAARYGVSASSISNLAGRIFATVMTEGEGFFPHDDGSEK